MENVPIVRQLPVPTGKHLTDDSFYEETDKYRLEEYCVSYILGKTKLKAAMNVPSICKEIEDMPDGNLKLVLGTLNIQKKLVMDGLDKVIKRVIFHAQKGICVDNILIWKKQERILLPSCISLIKSAVTALNLTKKLAKENGDCTTVENNTELDSIARLCMYFGPVVRAFVIAIYPPMCLNLVHKIAWKIVKLVHKLLNKVRECHFFREVEDDACLNYVLNSVDPNNNKLQRLLHPYVSGLLYSGVRRGEGESDEEEELEEESSYDGGDCETSDEDYVYQNEDDGDADYDDDDDDDDIDIDDDFFDADVDDHHHVDYVVADEDGAKEGNVNDADGERRNCERRRST